MLPAPDNRIDNPEALDFRVRQLAYQASQSARQMLQFALGGDQCIALRFEVVQRGTDHGAVTGAAAIKARMSPARHATHRWPSLTGRGYFPRLIPAHQLDRLTG